MLKKLTHDFVQENSKVFETQIFWKVRLSCCHAGMREIHLHKYQNADCVFPIAKSLL